MVEDKAPQSHRVGSRGRPPGRPLALFLLGAALACLPALARASGTFFVDVQNPAASNAGPGTEAKPYRMISAAVAAHPGPATTILVKPGVYRDAININTSGSTDAPYVIRALGGPVVVDGADDFSSPAYWTPDGSGVWLAASVTWNPAQVFLNGQRLALSPGPPAQLAAMSFTWVSGLGLYVNAGGDNPGTSNLLVGRRPYGFHMSRRSDITIDGITIIHPELYGVDVADSCTRITVIRDSVTFAGEYGIRISGGREHLIAYAVSGDNGNHGVAMTAGVTASTLHDNDCYRNADPETRVANGIYLRNAPANTLYRNRLHSNQDSGMHFQSGSDDCFAYNNISWNNGDHGYDHLFASGVVHFNDVAFHNFKDGFSIEGLSPGTHLTNCIAVDNGLTTNEYDLWVDANSTSGFVSDYNVFWNSTPQAPVKYISVYPSVASYSAVSGQDTHTLQTDPEFLDADEGDFRLRYDSPAIDSGDSRAGNWPAFDAVGRARQDDPATPNTGIGVVSYCDRGALEFGGGDQPPVVSAPSSAAGTEGQPLSVSVTVTDADGDAIIALEALGIPAGATFTPDPSNQSGTLTWTPSGSQAGTYQVDFRATNSMVGIGTTMIVVAAEPVNRPPAASLVLDQHQGVEPLAVNADASGSVDPDGTVVSYLFDFGDGSTAGPQGSPLASHSFPAGTWIINLTVRDDAGAAATVRDTVQVSEIPGLPNLVTNPSFEQGLDGWNSYSGADLERVSGGYDGTHALQMRGFKSFGSFGVNDSPNWVAHTGPSGRRYRFNAYVRSDQARGSARLRVREYVGSELVGGSNSPSVTLSDTWQKLSLDYVTAGSGSTLDFQITDFPVADEETFLTDLVSIRNVSGGSSSGGPGPGDSPLRAAVSPVPSRSRSVISFVLTQPGPLHVVLYDMAGRKVRNLLDDPSAPAGLYELPVERRAADQLLSAGVYFFRIRAAEGASSGRLVFIP